MHSLAAVEIILAAAVRFPELRVDEVPISLQAGDVSSLGNGSGPRLRGIALPVVAFSFLSPRLAQ